MTRYLHRWLLRLLPRRRRDRYAGEMAAVFEDLCGAAKRERGVLALPRLWMKEAAGILRFAARERFVGLHAPTSLNRSYHMDALIHDLRCGIRQLLRQRASSLVAVVTLALGIGASTAIFSVIDAAMLKQLPYPDPDQLVTVYRVSRDSPDGRYAVSVADMRTWNEHVPGVFSQLATWRNESVISLEGPEPERLDVMRVNADYLPLHGIAPIAGRGFMPEDMHLTAPPVVLLGHAYWQRQFNGNREIVGRQITLAGESAMIVGILPPARSHTTPIWRPLQLTDEAARAQHFRVFGRLRPGISIQQAQRDLSALADRLEPGTGIALESMTAYSTRGRWTTLRILLVAVLCVLAIACVNTAGLQLARGAARQHEIAIRASIGAGRARLVRQLLTETVVLYVAAGALGVVVAGLSLEFLVANIPLTLRSEVPVQLDLRVLGFSVALAIVTGIGFGLVPALRLSSSRLGSMLARTKRAQGSALSRRGGQVVVAAEVAIAVVLLSGAGLMIRTFARINAVDLGFEPSAFLTMEVTPLDSRPAAYEEFYRALLERLRAIPGVAAAGAIDTLPLGGSSRFGVLRFDGKAVPIDTRQVLPGYFEAIGLPLVAGRLLTDGDGMDGVVVNDEAARSIFGGAAVGRRIGKGNTQEVVGVVGNLRHSGPERPAVAELYVRANAGASSAAGQQQGRPLIVVVRPAPGMASQLPDLLRQAAQMTGQRALVRSIQTGDAWLTEWTTAPRQRTVLLGLLGGIGVLLAFVGIFGVTAYSVARRTQEIGLRMTFGARPQQVVRTILRDAAWPIGIGTIAGIGGAALTTRIIESFLFETTPTDAATFAGVALTLVLIGSLAALVPALHAARVDPAITLRAE
jgi:predicted permease